MRQACGLDAFIRAGAGPERRRTIGAGQTIEYEQLSGRAFGELDPRDPLNSLIQDIELGKDKDGKVRYTASFVLTRPKNMNQASGLLWHDVPNRGRSVLIAVAERNRGGIGLASAWQGDNAGNTVVRDDMKVDGAHWLRVPVARNPDGSAVTGRVFGRIVNRSGAASQPLLVQSNPVPYKPASLDSAQDVLVTLDGETTDGKVINERIVPRSDWAWAKCTDATPFPGIPDPTQICVKGGFNPAKLYQVSFTAKDPYVLGIGFAAWRDVGEFFKTAAADDLNTPNPVARQVTHSIARGQSQSGNFLRGWLHMGFNQTESRNQLHEGMWPIIAGRRIALNFRWAQPDGVLELYQAGSEGPQWWARSPDQVRGLPPAGILDRCEGSKTCPKVIKHFGSAGQQARGRNIPDLVEANKQAMGFPTLPGLRPTVPEPDFIMPVLDYDWGPDFNYSDASGIPANAPPPIKQVLRMLVPRVDADGNEVGGVPVVLLDAPLGTYLGWNITAGGARPFHKDQICNYVGGMIPFARTREERMAKQDPRLSLEERYGSHANYVARVRQATANAVARGFLLQPDADALVAEAEASKVLR